MKKTSLDQVQQARAKLIARISLTQKQADAAKKSAKLAKLEFRQAKKKLKEAKRNAKILRKAVKSLKNDLAAVVVKKKVVKQPAKVKATPRLKVTTAVAPGVTVAIDAIPAATEKPPGSPSA